MSAMRPITIIAFFFMPLALAGGDAQTANILTEAGPEAQIDIVRPGQIPSTKGTAPNFTGNVRVDGIIPSGHPSNISGGIVTFEPGARTAWHSHSKGQRIIIIQGVGWVQQWGGPKLEVRPGDVVWFPPDMKHWHGAVATTGMSHYALVENFEGRSSDWMESVTDAQYMGMRANQTTNRDIEFPGKTESRELQQLPVKQQKIAIIAALSASGDIARLRQVLVEGLEAGLTVNEIKEVLVHVHAYAGFPRALNAINAFIAVMDEREKAGINDIYGPEASPLTIGNKYEYGHEVLARLRNPNHVPGQSVSSPRPRYETFTPIIEVFLKEHLFASLFGRDVLDYLSRQIATVGVLSNLPGTNAQLRPHIGITMIQGASEEQMWHLFTMMEAYLGRERSRNALAVLQEVVSSGDSEKPQYGAKNSESMKIQIKAGSATFTATLANNATAKAFFEVDPVV